MISRSPALHQGLDHLGGERLRVMPQHLRVGKRAVPQRVEHQARDLVLLVLARRLARVEVVDVAEHQVGAFGPHRRHAQPVRQVHHMDRGERARPAANARRVLALAIALDAGGVGLVERRPMLDPVAEPPHGQLGIFGEPRRGVAVLPAAAVFERLRQIPMVETDPGLDPGGENAVDQAIVEFETLLVGHAPALGQDARPGG